MNDERAALARRMLPEGTPRLWCPPIAHYADDGGFDVARTRAHLARLAPWVKGFLLPGSTGDGWEMDDAEARALLEIALEAAPEFGFRVLVGVLKTEVEEARETIRATTDWLRERTKCADVLEAMIASNVCGFTVCPPKGTDLGQAEIRSGLEDVLAENVPLSLYQLPQVTSNEMSPETVAGLAGDWSNLILFKDTSGGDRVVKSGADLGGVFTVRGAEGDYATWPRSNGGLYDGFLLSTANTFPKELATVLKRIDVGDQQGARELSDRLDGVVKQAFAAVAGLEFGNAFANANKAMDHVMAWGKGATEMPGPLTHSGRRIPASVIAEVSRLLEAASLAPGGGYFEAEA